jgi:Tol biopolymer transport system component/DNA-binding winged helix-turn-helix (wHTH) protein
MANKSKHTVYTFDDFRLDTAELMLYRGGREISLPPKVVETLVVLIEHRGEITGKDELINRVWADSIVEESNLSQCLYRLRKTLGLRADGKPYIETFRRRGYRFSSEVLIEEVFSPAAGAASPAPQIDAPPRYDVERRGNVLKLVDWKETEDTPTAEAPFAAEAVKTFRRQSFPLAKIMFVALAVLVLIFAAFYFRRRFTSPVEMRASAKNELTFTRLTNGSAPFDATISPRGDYFVYHEQDGATAHLWLQQTGQSNRVEIIAPMEKILGGKTFSPDGQFIYFVAKDDLNTPQALYRVPTLGGVPVRIINNINSTVSFSPDGRQMVFQRRSAPDQKTFLIIADSAGGDERVLLAWNKEQGLLGYPAWSPDGASIAFTGYNYLGGGSIYLLNLQTGATEMLSPEKWTTFYRMVWTHDGAGLVFIGTKAGEAYSTRRDQIYYLSAATGESRRLTTDGNRHQVASLGVSEADEILVVPFNRSSQIWQMTPNGDARTAVQITSGLADGRAGLAALPDGRIAYIARVGESLSVWTANADGTNQKQLTYDPPVVEEVRASPDGRFLAFSAIHDGYSNLFLMNADGTNLRQLTFGNASDVDSAFSPDGNWLVYTSQITNDNEVKTSLKKISTSGGEPILLADIDCLAPNFSPDGQFISCVYTQNKFAVISAKDGQILKTFEPVQVPYFNIGARFSPDSRNLIYIARRKNFSNLWQQPIDGGAPEPLTDFTSGDLHNFTFSTDGTRLYIARGYQIIDAVLIKNFK